MFTRLLEQLRGFFRITPAPLSDYERSYLDVPLRVISVVFIVGMAFCALFFAPPEYARRVGILAVFAVAYGWVHYRWVRLLWNRSPIGDILFACLHAVVLALAGLYIPEYGGVLVVVIGGGLLLYLVGLGGRTLGYIFVVIAALVLIFSPDFEVGEFPRRIYFLTSVGTGAVLIEMATHWRNMMARQVNRLRAINRVSQALVTSIDPASVVTLLATTIQDVLNADTYFIARLMGDHLHLNVLYDEGEVFGPLELDKDAGLAGWVLRNRRSLLLTNVPQEIEALDLERRIVGKGRPNLSWLGAPMDTGGHLVGLIAVGSYSYNAFDENDQEMLESIAQQAALAFVNAHHHQQVQEQARRDSLTGVYNHGYFLQRLDQLIQAAVAERDPLAVIMLDVDHFKHYNDTYGHQLGDRVLVALARTIERHIKRSDVVGRWGGEEFGIALPRVDVEQAYRIARRIQTTMAEMDFVTPQGDKVPAPTVSQGFAMCPSEADDTYALISLADRRLYEAKEFGRNRIMGPEGVSHG